MCLHDGQTWKDVPQYWHSIKPCDVSTNSAASQFGQMRVDKFYLTDEPEIEMHYTIPGFRTTFHIHRGFLMAPT